MRVSTSIVCAISAAPFSSAAQSPDIIPRADACQTGYTICAPSGATTTSVPTIQDTAFRSLFTDLVNTGLPDGNTKKLRREDGQLVRERDGGASLCCQESMLCSSMSGLSIPFCYDKFTTNFFLPDGSYGTLYFGTYTSAAGDTANLISGDYTLKSGGTGNIYASDPNEKPNTATMNIPSQFTGTGVGSAIPASVLGGYATVVYTTVIEPTTIPPTTLPGSTVVGTSTGSGGVFMTTTTLPGSTKAGTTITAETTVITTATVGASEASAISAANSSKNAADGDARRHSMGGVLGGLFLSMVGFVL